MQASTDITPELLAGFIDEADEYLATLSELLLQLEDEAAEGPINFVAGEKQELMNVMFRAAHSLKGLSGAFGFAEMNSLNHRMETLFDEARMGKRDLDLKSIEALLTSQAVIQDQVEELKDPSDKEIDVTDAMNSLQAILDSADNVADDSAASDGDASASPSDSAEPAGETAPDASAVPETVLDDPELKAIFLQTTEDDIEDLNQNLLKLEESAEQDLLTETFRIAHTIKSACGAAGLSDAHDLTHRLETRFDQLLSGSLSLSDSLMATFLGVADRLREVIDQIKQGSYEPWTQDQIEDLFGPENETADSAKATMQGAEEQSSAASDPQVSGALSEGQCGYHVQIGFDPENPETDLQVYLVYNKLKDLGQVISSQPDMEGDIPDAPFTSMEVVIATEQANDEHAAQLKTLLETFIVKSVSVKTLGADSPDGTGSNAPQEPEVSEAEPAVLQKEETIAPTKDVPQAPPSAPEKQKTPPTPPAAKKQKAPAVQETIRVDVERLDQLMNFGGELVINRARFSQIERQFKEVFEGKDHSFVAEDIAERLHRLKENVREFDTASGPGKVLAEQIDGLGDDFDSIRQVLGRIREKRSNMHSLTEAVNTLGRLSDSIQKQIMGTRMVPVGPLFTRFKRVVRDAAKSLGKKIDYQILGEQTELDKKMIDELSDPLTHMIRNSVDHGIETPEVRIKAGKPATGTLRLEAYHQGNNICIRLQDDGKGIDIAAIRAKIVQKELATEAQAQQFTDREIVQYIFHPGMSTAEKVSDLSGRGMGMDIVTTKIASLNGLVEVDTQAGEGTTVIIKLPLTLAIITSLLSRIGSETYAIPLESVSEIVTISPEDMNSIQKQKVITVRGHVIPVFRLEDLLGITIPSLKTDCTDDQDWTLVILGTGAERIGLVVDQMIGQEEIVIKSLSENYTNIPGFAGATIMGDGRISLILDPTFLLDPSKRASSATADRKEVLN